MIVHPKSLEKNLKSIEATLSSTDNLGLLVLDKNGGLEYLSSQFNPIFFEQNQGHTERRPNSNYAFVQKKINNLFQKGDQNFQFALETSSPEKRIFKISGTIVPDLDSVSCLIEDKSEKKKREKDLHNLILEKEALINSTPDIIWAVDRELRLLSCNDTYAFIVEHVLKRKLEMHKSVIYDDLPEELVNKWKKLYGRALSGESFEITDKLDHEGHVKYSRIAFNPIRDHENNLIGVSCSSQDKTELMNSVKFAEEEALKAKKFQVQLLSSQLNPHFLFNALSSIQHYILNEKPVPAIDYLSKFSSLVRMTLNNSTKTKITWSEEIKFLNNYVALEKSRFEEKFDFTAIYHEKIEQILLPPMLIQPFIENAIIHGLRYKEGQGKLELIGELQDQHLSITIRDNGIGRKKAAQLSLENSGHKSMGLNLLNQRLDLLKEIYNDKMEANIIDLVDENGESIGTEVVLTIPAEFDV